MPTPIGEYPPFKKLFIANSTNAAAFATPYGMTGLADATMPAGGAFVDAGQFAGNVMFRFFGRAADGDTGEVRVSALRKAGGFPGAGGVTAALYLPTPICSFTFTLSAMPGVAAGGNMVVADVMADTLARLGGIGVDNQTDRVVSPAGLNVPASVVVDCTWSRYFLVELRRGTATQVNGEWTVVN